MRLLTAAIVGLLAGTHVSTWGMYKDAIHEGFELRKYLRSILLGGAIATMAVYLTDLDVTNVSHLIVLFGLTYVIERAACEFYKGFLREESQDKYAIPMQFAVRGRIVRSRSKRLLFGLAIIAVDLALLSGVIALARTVTAPSLVLVIAVGSMGGWISALGGAWKDAPIEGFDVVKFFRSPLWAAGYSWLLWSFNHNLVLNSLAALGFTIATLETYKKFFFPRRPAGKFAGKPIRYPQMLEHRKWFVPVYAAIWLMLLSAFAAATDAGSLLLHP